MHAVLQAGFQQCEGFQYQLPGGQRGGTGGRRSVQTTDDLVSQDVHRKKDVIVARKHLKIDTTVTYSRCLHEHFIKLNHDDENANRLSSSIYCSDKARTPMFRSQPGRNAALRFQSSASEAANTSGGTLLVPDLPKPKYRRICSKDMEQMPHHTDYSSYLHTEGVLARGKQHVSRRA